MFGQIVWQCKTCFVLNANRTTSTSCVACGSLKQEENAADQPPLASGGVAPPLASLARDLSVLMTDQDTADVVFVVEENKEISAHKIILISRSEYFANLFNSGMRESNGNQPIPIAGISANTFRKVLCYIYTSDPGEMTAEEAIDLLRRADMFQMEELKSICVEHIVQAMSNQNFLSILLLGRTTNSPSLKDRALDFISRNRYDSVLDERLRSYPIESKGDGEMIQEAYSAYRRPRVAQAPVPFGAPAPNPFAPGFGGGAGLPRVAQAPVPFGAPAPAAPGFGGGAGIFSA